MVILVLDIDLGIQTVSVGQTEGLNTAGIHNYWSCINVTDGHISGVDITNPQFFYKPRDIYNVGYSSITGITTITTAFAHNLSVGNEVVVSGIAFTCDYAPKSSANYDNTTGIMTVTTLAAHGLSVTGKSSDVILTGNMWTWCYSKSYSTGSSLILQYQLHQQHQPPLH